MTLVTLNARGNVAYFANRVPRQRLHEDIQAMPSSALGVVILPEDERGGDEDIPAAADRSYASSSVANERRSSAVASGGNPRDSAAPSSSESGTTEAVSSSAAVSTACSPYTVVGKLSLDQLIPGLPAFNPRPSSAYRPKGPSHGGTDVRQPRWTVAALAAAKRPSTASTRHTSDSIQHSPRAPQPPSLSLESDSTKAKRHDCRPSSAMASPRARLSMTAESGHDSDKPVSPRVEFRGVMLSVSERAAIRTRAQWPITLSHPIAALVVALGIPTCEYEAWLIERGLHLPTPEAVLEYTQQQQRIAQAQADAEGAAQQHAAAEQYRLQQASPRNGLGSAVLPTTARGSDTFGDA